MEAKQSQLKPGEREPDLFGDGQVIPLSPSGRAYDKLMIRAQAQAKNYAHNLPDDHPRVPFLIVCDVGRAFEIFYDLAGQGRNYGFYPDARSYRIPLARLREPEVQALLRDIWTAPEKRDPKLLAADVTRKVSQRLAAVSGWLEETQKIKIRELSAREQSLAVEETALFVMRLLFCMFAEDIGLLPPKRFTEFLETSVENEKQFYNGLHDLWSKMNAADGNRFAFALQEDVRYFNGGLFDTDRTYVLSREARGELLAAAKHNWRNVEPAIFGTLLEQALPSAERAKLGAHYTPRAYVERVIDATVMEVLNAEWTAVQDRLTDPAIDANEARALAAAFHDRLAKVTVLDPACGTDNFLYVAMEAIERLEAQVIEVRRQLGDPAAARVAPHQFLGLEKNPRAAKIAELVLWIGWLRFRIGNDPDSIADPVLRSAQNINFGRPGGYDAVLDEATGLIPDWPAAEFIVGNPPFIGGKDLRAKLGGDYAEALWRANPRVPKSADFVMQWWDRAAHRLTAPGTTLRRFGFVTTNSITQTFSRRVIAGYLAAPDQVRGIEKGDTLVTPGSTRGPASSSAERSLEGSGTPAQGRGDDMSGRGDDMRGRGDEMRGRGAEMRSRGDEEGAPETTRKLSLILAVPDHPWTRATSDAAAVRIAITVAEAGARPGRLLRVVSEAALDSDAPVIETRESVGTINADLTAGTNVTATLPLRSNAGLASNGMKPLGSGFIVAEQEIEQLSLRARDGWKQVVRPYVNGRDLMQAPRGVFALDLFGLDERAARLKHPEVYQHLLATVRPERLAAVSRLNTADAREYADKWWLFCKPRQEMRAFLTGLDRFIVTTQTAKHRVFQFLSSDIMPDQKLMVFGFDDAFHLGVLSSRVHEAWAIASGGWLGVGNDSVYSKSRSFDPFPFPEPSPAQRAAIAEIAEELDATRKRAIAEVPRLTMTELYNLRAKWTAGTLTPAERDRAVAAQAGIVAHLHDQLDAAVAAAYGWDWPMPPADIVARLVALNAARAAEEAAGRVCWLRPEYQQARFAKAGQRDR